MIRRITAAVLSLAVLTGGVATAAPEFPVSATVKTSKDGKGKATAAKANKGKKTGGKKHKKGGKKKGGKKKGGKKSK